MFKQPKGLAVCELQAAGPLILPWSCDCCSNPDIQWAPAWSVPWSEIPADTIAHSSRGADLKTIYQAADKQKALAALDRVIEKWTPKYPNFMKRWKDNWDAVSPIFKFSTTVRKVIYTTNAIESLNSTYRKLNRQRSVFPSDTALLKALYLATFEAMKK